MIVCAPPYFENSTLSGCKEIDVARHKLNLSFDDIINFSKIHLSENGILSMIIPFN